jgi:hypothetical protein
MAGPCVAGICALILEANPYLSAMQVKHIIRVTAREDNKTGDIPDTGSTTWGYGKINAYLAVKLALGTVGIEEVKEEVQWKVYPNPSSDNLTIDSPFELPEKIAIVSIDGKILETSLCGNDLDISNLDAGKYYLRIERNGRIEQISFVKL